MLPSARAQDAPAAAKTAYNKVIGEVVSIDPDGKKMTVKEDSGSSSDVILDAETSFMRVPPGEKDLRKATRIDLKDISAGDRIYARSRKVEGQDATAAVSVILMSKTELAQHQEKTRDEWQRRGSAGRVKSIDPASKTIVVSVQSAGGAKDLTVETDDKTSFRRYAPDSVKFADAQPSKMTEIVPGNNLRVLGDKSEDGAKIHAEAIVSGSFRNLAGTVASVDAANNQITLNDLVTKKPVTIKVNADTNLRKLPAPMAAMIAHSRADAPANAGAPGVAAGQPKGQGGPDSHPGFNGPANPGAIATNRPGATGSEAAGTRPAGAGQPGGPSGAGKMDMNHALERAPQFALADLKPGDALIVSSTNGVDPSRVTAIAVVAGVEPILAAAPVSGRSGQGGSGGAAGGGGGGFGGMPSLDMGFPQ